MTRTFLANVPVVPVLFHLGKVPDARGRYFCPFHDDERPGGKPSAEVRDDPTLLTCWSCGASATAAEIISKTEGIPLAEAADVAIAVAGSVVEVKKKKRDKVSPARLEAELRRLTEGIRFPRDVDPVDAFLRTKANFAARMPDLAAFARESWEWRGDYRGRVVIPHRDTDGVLRGLRFRVPPDWEKDGRKDSSFRQLYGSWRIIQAAGLASVLDDPSGKKPELGPDEIWVCEGETDSLWGSYWLRTVGVGVVGVATAGYRPRGKDLELFRGKTAVLVHDPGEAGDRGRAKWVSALAGVTKRTVHLFLDDGLDLSETPQTPLELRELI